MSAGWLSKKRKAITAIALAVVMIVAAGCQAVSGLDLNGVLKNALKVQSMEGTQSVGFKMTLKPGALDGIPPEEAAIVSLLSDVKLELTDIKMKDANTGSYNGALSLGDTRIGFSLQTAEDLTVLKLDGIARPIELDLTADALNGLLGGGGLPGFGYGYDSADIIDNYVYESAEEDTEVSQDLQAEVKKLADSLIDIVGGYAIDNLPNPTRLTVTPVTEEVGGETLPLMKVHADINGKELWQWAGAYLDALIADEEGLKEMLTGVIELFAESEELWTSLDEENPFADVPQGAERDAEIEEGVDAFVEALTELRKEYGDVEEDEIDTFFGENTYIKADLYADAKLHIRKQNLEFGFKPAAPAAETEADADASSEEEAYEEAYEESYTVFDDVEGIVLTVDSESWNVNGDVTPAAPVKTLGAITVEELGRMQGYHFLRQTDRQSPLYDLLRNKLHIGRQEMTLYPAFDENPPIVTPDGRTLVPLRQVASELGASVVLNPDKTIRVYDDGAYSGIDLRLGSADVKVNGKAMKWSYPVTRLSTGVTYVPAKDLAAALGCKIAWEPAYEGADVNVFVISREVD